VRLCALTNLGVIWEVVSLMVTESVASKFSLVMFVSIGTLCVDESTPQLGKHCR
jgi:hypothetical protein